MAEVSDYAIATPGRVTLDSGLSRSETFSLRIPENVLLGEQTFLSLMTEIHVGNPDPQFAWEVRVNDRLLNAFAHSQDDFGAVQIQISRLPGTQPQTLRPGPDNEVTVRIQQGSGQLEVSDIIAHFKVDV